MLLLASKYTRRILVVYSALAGVVALFVIKFHEVSAFWIVLIAVGCADALDQVDSLGNRVLRRTAKAVIFIIFIGGIGVWYYSGGLHSTVQYVACSMNLGCREAVHWRIAHALKPLHFTGFQSIPEKGSTRGSGDRGDPSVSSATCSADFGGAVQALSYGIHTPARGVSKVRVKYRLHTISTGWKIKDHVRMWKPAMPQGGLPEADCDVECDRVGLAVKTIEFNANGQRIDYNVCIEEVGEKSVRFASGVVELIDVESDWEK